MTAELYWLALTSLLAAMLWIPFVIGIGQSNADGELPQNFNRPPDLHSRPAWVQRAYRAHLNMIEQLVPFAALVLIAPVASVSNAATQLTVAALLWLRVAHALVMVPNIRAYPLRPIIFTLGWIATLVMGWQVLAA
ncbi:MAG: MAPEG family protein [Pseudomonadota bacterium]